MVKVKSRFLIPNYVEIKKRGNLFKVCVNIVGNEDNEKLKVYSKDKEVNLEIKFESLVKEMNDDNLEALGGDSVKELQTEVMGNSPQRDQGTRKTKVFTIFFF